MTALIQNSNDGCCGLLAYRSSKERLLNTYYTFPRTHSTLDEKLEYVDIAMNCRPLARL